VIGFLVVPDAPHSPLPTPHISAGNAVVCAAVPSMSRPRQWRTLSLLQFRSEAAETEFVAGSDCRRHADALLSAAFLALRAAWAVQTYKLHGDAKQVCWEVRSRERLAVGRPGHCSTHLTFGTPQPTPSTAAPCSRPVAQAAAALACCALPMLSLRLALKPSAGHSSHALPRFLLLLAQLAYWPSGQMPAALHAAPPGPSSHGCPDMRALVWLLSFFSTTWVSGLVRQGFNQQSSSTGRPPTEVPFPVLRASSSTLCIPVGGAPPSVCACCSRPGQRLLHAGNEVCLQPCPRAKCRCPLDRSFL